MMTGLMLVLTAVRYVDPSSHGVFPQPYDDAAKTQRPLVDFIRLRHLKYMKNQIASLEFMSVAAEDNKFVQWTLKRHAMNFIYVISSSRAPEI